MMNYKTLFTLRVEHDYFKHNICKALTLNVKTQPLSLFRDRQLLLQKTGENQWEIIGDPTQGGVYEGVDKVEFYFALSDPFFLYYTFWKNFDLRANYLLELTPKEKELEVVDCIRIVKEEKEAGVLFSCHLDLTDDLYKKSREGVPELRVLRFRAKEMLWEYLFIQRKDDFAERHLLLEEMNGLLEFSKPLRISSTLTHLPVWQSRSQTPVKMKEYYDYNLNLLEVYQVGKPVKHTIVKEIDHPQPGIFYDLEEGVLRQIVYIN